MVDGGGGGGAEHAVARPKSASARSHFVTVCRGLLDVRVRGQGQELGKFLAERDLLEQFARFLKAIASGALTAHSAANRPQLLLYKLEDQLAGLARGILEREFRVTDAPHRAVCDGCPAEGGLCSWPLEMTRRDAADRLF